MASAHFDAHWLAEALRLREQRSGRLDDAALRDELARLPADFETRALARARALAHGLGWDSALSLWHRNARLSLLGLAALASTSGAGLALATLGDAARPVNLVWALGGLLGMHALALILWLFGMASGGAAAGGALGQAWLGLTRRFTPTAAGAELAAALPRLLARNRLVRWLLGMVSHGLWAVLLLSALLTLLALLSVRRYTFVWETTLLDGAALSAVVEGLGALPALLGVATPDFSTLTSALQDDPTRRAWAHWLVACVLCYGLAPRLLLWLFCRQRWRAAGQSLHIDLAAAGNLQLRQHLLPDHLALGVADPAPDHLVEARAPQVRLDTSAGSALVGVELGSGLAWPPALVRPLKLLERVETREQRRELLARLAVAPPRRLLVACDARLSPDRGSYALISELAACSGEFALWLMLPAAAAPGARLQHWREGLLQMGFAPQQIITDTAPALQWLEAVDG